MRIDFSTIPETVLPQFKGGEKEMRAHMFKDGQNLIMRASLCPGASIGLHCHDSSSEIIYILSGSGKVLFEGSYESLGPGACHYCPKGCSHSLINSGSEDLVFFAVVPQQ